MSQHDAYIERMTTRLGEIEAQIRTMAQQAGQDGPRQQQVRDLEASLAVARERLQNLRRAGAEVTEEMTRSFAQSFERLNAEIARARGGHAA